MRVTRGTAPRSTAAAIVARLHARGQPARAAVLRRFFKTGRGQYGEGDRFLGLTVPEIRAIAADYPDLPLGQIDRLLGSPWHEVRLLALVILVDQYARADPAAKTAIYRLYLRRTNRINNWDLVDSSAPGIVGAHLSARSRRPLRRLAGSKSLWERRIAILATFTFIRQGQFDDTLDLAARLLTDPHDLMHKAIGWMLREVGKRNEPALTAFLDRHAPTMPRTALRYAIERLSASQRHRYLNTRRLDSPTRPRT